MRKKLPVLGLTLLLSWPALAQTPPDRPLRDDVPQGTSRLPIDAMLHHQPRRADVRERESARLGEGAVEAQRRRQADIDEIYDEVMRRSAPPKPQ
jgi:hypothetical protein